MFIPLQFYVFIHQGLNSNCVVLTSVYEQINSSDNNKRQQISTLLQFFKASYSVLFSTLNLFNVKSSYSDVDLLEWFASLSFA